MCQLKVSFPTGHSQPRFDVYYFEIRHRRKTVLRGFTGGCVGGCVCVCIMKNAYVFNNFIVLCKSGFVCMSVGVSIHQREASKLSQTSRDGLLPQIAYSRSISGEGKIWG